MNAITRTLVGASLVLFGFVASAQESSTKQIALDIKPQPMVDALNGWAQQTGFQIIWPDEESTSELDAPRVKGRLTAQAALSKLLAGTPLTYEFVNERTVAIHEQFPASRPVHSLAYGKQVDRRFLRIAAAQVEGVVRSSDVGAAESASRALASANAREAESSKRQQGALDEIIVSAQKRQELLQDVPIAIATLSGDDLDQSTMQGIAEALNTVPGVAAMENWNGMGTRLSVRGVTPNGPLFAGSSPIGYYLDSIPFGLVRSALAPDAGAYDLQRVEVLRGPQGTLYGASSLNGVVRVLTHEADLDEFQFKARTLGSTTEKGADNYRGDMAVNVPLVEGKLAARLTAGHENLSGWIDRPGEENANDAEIDTVRLKLKAKPTEKLNVDLQAWLSRADYGAPNTGDDDNQHASLFAEPHSADYDMFGLELAYEFSSFTLTSSSSYMDFTAHSQTDLSPFCCAPLNVISDFSADFFAQEILASSTGDGPWRWSLGAFYRDASDRTVQDQVIEGQDIPNSLSGFDDESESWAVFGEVTRLLLDGRLELTAGVRYFEDRIGTRDNAPGATASSSDNFDSLTPRFVITGHVTDDVMVYASYSEGFRSGLLQAPVAAAAGVPPAKPDTLKNYEVGTKMTLSDHGLSIDGSVYYIDWEDALRDGPLVFLNGVPYTSLVNGASSSGMGVDLAVTAYPTDRLTLGFNLSVNDLTFDETAEVPGRGIVAIEGERLPGSPAETYGVFADYEFPLWQSGFTGRIAASANYISEVTVGTTTVVESDPLLIGRASFAVSAPRYWEAALFVNNLNNEQGIAAPNPFALPSWYARVRPRTYGIQLEYRF